MQALAWTGTAPKLHGVCSQEQTALPDSREASAVVRMTVTHVRENLSHTCVPSTALSEPVRIGVSASDSATHSIPSASASYKEQTEVQAMTPEW